jgi:hypothetical protein
VPHKKNGEEVLQEKNKLKAKEYERELRKLQTKLVEMQERVRATGAKIVLCARRPRCRGQGRGDSPHYGARQSAGVPSGGFAGSHRVGKVTGASKLRFT